MSKPWTQLPLIDALKSHPHWYRMCNAVYRGTIHFFASTPFNLYGFTFVTRSFKEGSLMRGYEETNKIYGELFGWGCCYWPYILWGMYSGVFPLRYGNLFIDVF